MSEHYVGPGASSTSHTLTKATREAPELDRRANLYTCCPWTLCLYTDPEGSECLEPIDCGTASNHFKNKHGIANMGREIKLVCAWQNCGCQVTRHNNCRTVIAINSFISRARFGATKDVYTSRPIHPGTHHGGMTPPYDTIRSKIMLSCKDPSITTTQRRHVTEGLRPRSLPLTPCRDSRCCKPTRPLVCRV
ncbi:hypothetical protein EDD17DRAFT_75343 [Pisolithus thermaeus]|nr:hypothetical protein EDD17DRAFT_75343 [Pisolithus thermaeus]